MAPRAVDTVPIEDPHATRVSGTASMDGYPSFMIFDVQGARRDTPGTSRVAHLNNAGAALPRCR